MKTFISRLGLLLLVCPVVAQAIDLREATFTQVVNSVSVTDSQGNGSRPAQLNTKFATPEVIRTGVNSRAELTAADQTVTRVGANTIFSFKPEGRGINLQQGSVLFNSPSGKGGGTIQTAAATASVLGTTIIVSTTNNGGFKLLVLEGKAKATLPNGRDFVLKAGQMTFITPGMTQAPAVFEFRLGKQNDGSGLLKGFSKPLPAQDKVQQAVMLQEVKIANGDAVDTGLMIGQVVGNEIQVIDPSLIQAAMQTRLAENYDDLINKLKQSVSATQTVSTSVVNDNNVLLFPTAESLKLGLKAINANVLLDNPPAKTHVFAANDLWITSNNIDLSPYAGKSDTFAFYSKTSLYMPATLNVTGYGGELVFHADGTMTVPTALTYVGSNLQLECHNSGGLTLSSVVYHNTGGHIGITNFSGTVTLNGGNYDAGGRIEFEAYGNLNLYSSPSIIPGSELSLRANGGSVFLGNVTYNSTGRSLYVSASDTVTFSAGVYNNLNRIEVDAGNGIFITAGSMNVTGDIAFNAGTGTLSTGVGSGYTAGGYIEGWASNFNLSSGMFTTSGNIRFGYGSNATSATFYNSSFSGNIIDFFAQSITSSNSQILAQKDINIVSSNSGLINLDYSTLNTSIDNINIAGGTVSALYTNVSSNKDLYIKAVVGNVNLTSGTFVAKNTINVTAARSISINTSSFSSGVPATGTASFTAGSTSGDSITMNNVNFNTTNYYSAVTMQAHTIYLSNVDLNSNTQYYFKTLNGGWNFGAPTPGTTNLSNVSNSGTLLNSGNIGAATNLHFPSL